MSRPRLRTIRRLGFTLLEVLVAVLILAMAFLVIWRTFLTAVNGLTRGQRFMENLHHGDYVIEQLTSALRSAAFYESRKDRYGFWLDEENGEDSISWVTSSSAFMGPRSPYRNGLHRIQILIDEDDEGRDCFTVRAWSPLAEEDDEAEPEVWNISSKIVGLSCEVYNPDVEDWETRWEDTNSVPRLVKLTLQLSPVEKDDPPIQIQRLVEIQVAPPLGKTAVASGAAGSATPPASSGGGGTATPAPAPNIRTPGSGR